MSTIGQPTIFEDQIKKLHGILNNLKDIVPRDNDDDDNNDGINTGENYHLFCSNNLHKEKENVDTIISSMKTAYENFTKIQNPSNILKHVTERQLLNGLNRPIAKCLEDLKISLRGLTNDNTLKSTVQKLEALCAKEGLRFDKDNSIFISCDMFYIEIALDVNGLADDVKVHYTHTGGGDTSLKELVVILRNKDFEEFHVHLKGLKERYLLLKGDTFKKSKILSSLDMLEKDIIKIMQSDVTSNSITDMILSGPVGYVTPTVGGRHLSMTYAVDPLDLLDTRQPGLNKVFTREDPPHRGFGYSVSVCVEQAEETSLPTSSMVSIENNVLKYLKADVNNSIKLPAQFVLQFQKELPSSIFTAQKLQKLLNPDAKFSHESGANLDDLIIRDKYKMERTEWKQKEFYIDLPGETHVFRCLPSKEQENPGIYLSRIPFTQLQQVPLIIKILRSQAIYNMLLCSCFKSSELFGDNDELDDEKRLMYVFDVKSCEENILIVNFIHPLDDSLGSIDFVVTADANVECSLNILPGSPIICDNEYLNKVTNKCFSIPLVMKCLVKKSKTCRPEQVVTQASTSKLLQKTFQKPLKLVMPSISQMHTMSPQLTNSPSAFLNFSATGLSPGVPVFPTAEQSHGHKRKRTPSSTISTPSSDGSRTPSKLKLPKITLKRKRNEASEIYEIDKSKSDIETATSESNTPTTTASLTTQDSIDSLTFVYPQFSNDEPSLKRSNSVFSDGMTFPELAGIPLESDDLDNLLGIPPEPFVQNDSTSHLTGNVQPQAFDIDTIRGNNEMSFDSLPSNAIDPSALVTTPTSFDIDTNGMIDIDSLM